MVTIIGTNGNDSLLGTSAADSIVGLAGNDTLNGGAGADTMVGGTGNDIYYVDNIGDIVTENAGEGTDRVYSSITYTLGSNVENLTLTGSSAINGTGNSLNNAITGNSGNNILTGGAGNDTLNGGAGADTMIGGAGNDYFYVDNTGDVVTENANEGTDTISSTITLTLGNNVENLTLTGSSAINGTGNSLNNAITGNSGNNVLTGGAGDDTLDGLTGIDTMIGGAGNDYYYVNGTVDVVTENANEGTDTISSTITLTLGNNVENLTLTGSSAINGTGNSLDNRITGNSANNVLTGGAGYDTLDGGTGADTMIGGAGYDHYYVNNTGDVITENAGEDGGRVHSSITYTLGANLTDLILTGSSAINGTGNSGSNAIVGNTGNNVLTGGAGHDWLEGGNGADTMIGGTGDDDYVVDSTGDVVTENANEGTDRVLATINNYTLGNNLEDLTLFSTYANNGTGNSLNNYIEGNENSNVLYGLAGNDTLDGGIIFGYGEVDTMIGGTGNDTYIVDSSSDVVTENDGEGIDTVYTHASYSLGANIENLTLATIYDEINDPIAYDGYGNELDNIITGNSANNIISLGDGNDIAYGDFGNDTIYAGYALFGNDDDTMSGWDGDDSYRDVSANDVIIEYEDFGIDEVYARESYTLSDNVENLHLSGMFSDINGTGNDLDNYIGGDNNVNILIGNGGNDTLVGDEHEMGLFESDTLIGGMGNDSYWVDDMNDVVEEYILDGTDTVYATGSYILSDNVENLTLVYEPWLQMNGQDAFGNDLDNVITGNQRGNNLDGGMGNDTYYGGIEQFYYDQNTDYIFDTSGNDTYHFNSGDAVDFLFDSSGTDTIILGSDVMDYNIAFWKDNIGMFSLAYEYGMETFATDMVVISDWDFTYNQVEMITKSDGGYLSNTDVNQVIQDLTAYADANSITITSVDDVRNNGDLMNIIATAWNY